LSSISLFALLINNYENEERIDLNAFERKGKFPKLHS